MPEVMLLVKFSGLTWATPKESELELMRLKMVPWLCSCFRTILCFPCFLTIFYPCLSESMTSCTAAAWLAVLCIQISWMKRKQQNLCMRALSQKYYILLNFFFIFLLYFLLWSRTKFYKHDFSLSSEIISLWKIFYSLVVERCSMYHGQTEGFAQPFIKLGMPNFQKYTEAKYSFLG